MFMFRTVAIDFFCGAGGMTCGLISAGIPVLAGIDNEPLCEQTYRQNINPDGSTPEFLCKDIFPRTVDYDAGEQYEISEKLHILLKEYKRRHGFRRINLIFAICAPCQPFTRITRSEMSIDRKFKRSNDKNLLLTTLKIISEFRPGAVICENVEGIFGEQGSVLSEFRSGLEKLEYGFDARVLNFAKFGVPQNRRRTIGLGIDRRAFDVDISVPDSPGVAIAAPSVSEVIGHVPPIAAGEVHPVLPNHRARSLSAVNLQRISCAVPGESNAYLKTTPYGNLGLDCHQRLTERAGAPSFTDTYTRMNGAGLAPTITTKCISISNGRFGHFDTMQNRGLTPHEAALLQTFPENYAFYPHDRLHFTAGLIGNAVPPKVSNFFGSYLKDLMTAGKFTKTRKRANSSESDAGSRAMERTSLV